MTDILKFLPEEALSLYDNLEFLLRILLSGLFGLGIGMERAKRQKNASRRTHCIIAMAASVFMILSKYAFLDIDMVAGSGEADPSRIAAQAVCGISFLGAGIFIKRNSNEVQGLTTAAGMWATTAVGMSVGAGLYWVGVMLTALVIVSQLLLHRLPSVSDKMLVQQLTVQTRDCPFVRDALQELIARHNGRIEENSICHSEDAWTIRLTIRLHEPITYEEALDIAKTHTEIRKISV